MNTLSPYQDKKSLNRRFGAATLSGLCLALILRATAELCIPLAILFMPGLIGSFFVIGFPSGDPRPSDPTRDPMLIAATILNGLFYGGIFLTGFCIWIERKARRMKDQCGEHDCTIPPQHQAKSVGSLLDYDS